MADRQKYHERITAPIADPLATVVHLAARQGESDYVCYEGPEGWAFTSGVAAELTIDRHRLLLRGPGGETEHAWQENLLHQIPQILDDVPIESWRMYGWCGFDMATAKDGLMDLVGDDVFLHLVIPRSEIRFHSSGTLLRALDPADLDAMQAALEPAEAVPYRASPVEVNGHDADRYRAAVASAVQQIRDGRLQKVILSRTVPVEHPIDIVGTYAVGRRANSPARSFLFSLDGRKAAGFSPETVVEVSDDGIVTTQPLAGTRARTGVPAVDQALRTELLGDSKEIFEHAISVKVAYDELMGLCGEAVDIPEFMVIRERGTVQHLASSVRGRLDEGQQAWDAFAALFPAVTASGVPKRSAYSLIHELEDSTRGLYSGAVLAYDSDGAMDAALVLRTVFQHNGRTWLRAGAGIVEQSRPERELTETCEKLSSVARYLVPLGQ
ncbi:salicylate synthase [Nonomuraea antri]|uniref:salicylate synthase n=1 Tax=Nonomuraea antri TaxID=2730852 RepID=UPI001C2C6EEC|nr:salicylate synthase [Nonomuraea antri]